MAGYKIIVHVEDYDVDVSGKVQYRVSTSIARENGSPWPEAEKADAANAEGLGVIESLRSAVALFQRLGYDDLEPTFSDPDGPASLRSAAT